MFGSGVLSTAWMLTCGATLRTASITACGAAATLAWADCAGVLLFVDARAACGAFACDVLSAFSFAVQAVAAKMTVKMRNGSLDMIIRFDSRTTLYRCARVSVDHSHERRTATRRRFISRAATIGRQFE